MYLLFCITLHNAFTLTSNNKYYSAEASWKAHVALSFGNRTAEKYTVNVFQTHAQTPELTQCTGWLLITCRADNTLVKVFSSQMNDSTCISQEDGSFSAILSVPDTHTKTLSLILLHLFHSTSSANSCLLIAQFSRLYAYSLSREKLEFFSQILFHLLNYFAALCLTCACLSPLATQSKCSPGSPAST